MADVNNPIGGAIDKNAPNPTGDNIGGKVEAGKNEGGTQKSPADINTANSPTNPNPSVSPADAQKSEDKTVVTEETKDGTTTITKGVDQAAVDAAKSNLDRIPPAVNETQRMTGTPGNVNLTQNGRLNSDKSVREDRTLEDINAELNKSAGPNPLPLREGNELTRTLNGMTAVGVSAIDNNTNAMADDLEKIMDKDRLNQEDKDKLRSMRDELRTTGRF